MVIFYTAWSNSTQKDFSVGCIHLLLKRNVFKDVLNLSMVSVYLIWKATIFYSWLSSLFIFQDSTVPAVRPSRHPTSTAVAVVTTARRTPQRSRRVRPVRTRMNPSSGDVMTVLLASTVMILMDLLSTTRRMSALKVIMLLLITSLVSIICAQMFCQAVVNCKAFSFADTRSSGQHWSSRSGHLNKCDIDCTDVPHLHLITEEAGIGLQLSWDFFGKFTGKSLPPSPLPLSYNLSEVEKRKESDARCN